MARKSNEFEKSFQQLESIVKRLEAEELPLDEALQLFEEGIRLSRFCNQKLEEVEKKSELIHTYSLVHDDLPALDNDDLRRGRKTTHVVFGEAMGILAGDALLTEAFSWLASPIDGVDAARQLRALAEVARAVDSTGMIGG